MAGMTVDTFLDYQCREGRLAAVYQDFPDDQ